MYEFTTLGAVVGLAIAIVLIIRKVHPAYSLILGALFFALSILFPETILRIYMDVDAGVLAIGPAVMRIYGISFPLMGLNLVISYYLQSILLNRPSLVISLLRGVLLCSVLVFILPAALGFGAIWWTMVVTEVLTLIFSLLALRRHLKTF